MKKYRISALMLLTVLVFFGCDMTSSIINTTYVPDAQSAVAVSATVSDAYVYTDPVSKTAVYVDASGEATLIRSDEESGTVACLEVIDFIPLETESAPALSRGAGHKEAKIKALILGKRGDGSPGVWGVYTDGKVKPVINSEGFDTTELLDMVDGRQPLSGYFSWTYEATAMVSNEDASEIIVIGYAENSGVEKYNYSIEEDATVGVYWAVVLDEDGYYHISRAKVVGYKDAAEKDKSYKYNKKSEGKDRHRWMWSLKLFFAGWFDNYLVMTDSVTLGDNAGEYFIYGEDQDGTASVAVVTVKDVLSVEEYVAEEPDEENQAPVASFADWDLEISGAENAEVNQNYVVNGTAYSRTKYISTGSSLYEVFYYWDNTNFRYGWGINNTLLAYITSNSELDYYLPSVSLLPPETGWYNSTDDSVSSLSIVQVPINGNFSSTGYELTASYIFTDSDGDAEGASLYQWYRCDSADAEGVAIDGATEINYLTIASDNGSYLKFEVTPVDERGGTGTPVKSEATPMIGKTNT